MVAGPGALAARAAPPRAPPQGPGQREGRGVRGAGVPSGTAPPPAAVGAHMQAAFAAHQLLLFGGAGAERLFLGTGNSADPPPPFHVPSYPPTPHYPPAPQPLTCPFAAPTEAPPLPRAASRCAPMAPPSAVPRGWGKGGGGGERRERSAALRGAAAAGTESGPTGRVVVAGGGRRLHNSPVAARRFLRGEVRAARPAPLPGIGPSAAGALGETIFVIQPCLSQPAARPSVGFHGKLPSKTRRKGVTAGVTQPQLEASADEAENDSESFESCSGGQK
ncbi:sterile alpha motif domain-containing protein 1-like isoform X4 [Gallus gallus]|uniref:sterile alpha motif domain-containing protein 1-like isoform X4 n=1 Tax=Gallus gallus TaxID=9031 RepID=UPI001F00BD3E|nr:sterile alpha motif domain-containing protein 1-like isoform X4 [Gallus gallus]